MNNSRKLTLRYNSQSELFAMLKRRKRTLLTFRQIKRLFQELIFPAPEMVTAFIGSLKLLSQHPFVSPEFSSSPDPADPSNYDQTIYARQQKTDRARKKFRTACVALAIAFHICLLLTLFLLIP